MTQCWSEGELRAYLDQELPPRDMEQVARHLKECSACSGLYGELDGRVAWLSDLFEALPDAEPVVKLPQLRQPSRATWRWAAAAMAAALAIGFLSMPKPQRRILVPPTAHVAPPTPAKPVPQPAQVRPAIIWRRAPPKPKPQVQYYVKLDDEPIETGVVVRVGLQNGQVPADVILGPDGRPRAIRLVSDISGER